MGSESKKLKLPARLLSELGETKQESHSQRKYVCPTRKDARKAERSQKKTLRSGPPHRKRLKTDHVTSSAAGAHNEQLTAQRQTSPNQNAHYEVERSQPSIKSILKPSISKESRKDIVPTKRAWSVSPPSISHGLVKQLNQDDEEIAALEKKLGLKGRKSLPKSFKDDGLDELLEGFDIDDDPSKDQDGLKKMDPEVNEWLEQKRRKARKAQISKIVVEKKEDSDSDAISVDADGLDLDETLSMLSDDASLEDDEFNGFDSHSDLASPNRSPLPERRRENPYIAPVAEGTTATQKYIPPWLRNESASDTEDLIRLQRQAQGLVNRLTESNLISILNDVEKLYRENTRQHVTTVLIDLLLISVCEPTSLPDTLIILPAGFLTAIYKIIGIDFGAKLIQRLVSLFDEHYTKAKAVINTPTKESSNLIMLILEMYNFQLVGSKLIYDYIRIFLGELSELNTELLLKIVRASGPQLRHDNPSALKEIISMLRLAVTQVGEENLSVRTRFMIETINDLKNNRVKTGAAASAIMSEHTIRMKKILGTLNTRNIRASEPLRIGLKDIEEADENGKWWLVGARWAGNGVNSNLEPSHGSNQIDLSKKSKAFEISGVSDLAQLAKEQHMNTDIRRAIFITIMSASDYQDAYARLMKLRLKKVQELEIPKVLIHCAGTEKSYNPYYTLIAKKICGDRKLKMAFQFSLWDLFKAMGETDDEEDSYNKEDDSTMDMRRIVNLAKMFASLITDGGLDLGILKPLNLSYLQSKTKVFIEVLLITILLQSQRQSETKRDEAPLVTLFKRTQKTPQLIPGLQYFLKTSISKTDITSDKSERATLKWACKVAGRTLETLALGEEVSKFGNTTISHDL